MLCENASVFLNVCVNITHVLHASLAWASRLPSRFPLFFYSSSIFSLFPVLLFFLHVVFLNLFLCIFWGFFMVSKLWFLIYPVCFYTFCHLLTCFVIVSYAFDVFTPTASTLEEYIRCVFSTRG